MRRFIWAANHAKGLLLLAFREYFASWYFFNVPFCKVFGALGHKIKQFIWRKHCWASQRHYVLRKTLPPNRRSTLSCFYEALREG